MQIPEAFLKLTSYFHQDVDLFYPTGKGLVEDALSALTSEERQVVKDYPLDLVSGRYDEKELRVIWRSTKQIFLLSAETKEIAKNSCNICFL